MISGSMYTSTVGDAVVVDCVVVDGVVEVVGVAVLEGVVASVEVDDAVVPDSFNSRDCCRQKMKLS